MPDPVITKLIIKRGEEADRVTATLAAGELAYITDTKRLYTGDGSTLGGVPIPNIDNNTLVYDNNHVLGVNTTYTNALYYSKTDDATFASAVSRSINLPSDGILVGTTVSNMTVAGAISGESGITVTPVGTNPRVFNITHDNVTSADTIIDIPPDKLIDTVHVNKTGHVTSITTRNYIPPTIVLNPGLRVTDDTAYISWEHVDPNINQYTVWADPLTGTTDLSSLFDPTSPDLVLTVIGQNYIDGGNVAYVSPLSSETVYYIKVTFDHDNTTYSSNFISVSTLSAEPPVPTPTPTLTPTPTNTPTPTPTPT
jgi:hypothetical protein